MGSVANNSPLIWANARCTSKSLTFSRPPQVAVPLVLGDGLEVVLVVIDPLAAGQVGLAADPVRAVLVHRLGDGLLRLALRQAGRQLRLGDRLVRAAALPAAGGAGRLLGEGGGGTDGGDRGRPRRPRRPGSRGGRRPRGGGGCGASSRDSLVLNGVIRGRRPGAGGTRTARYPGESANAGGAAGPGPSGPHAVSPPPGEPLDAPPPPEPALCAPARCDPRPPDRPDRRHDPTPARGATGPHRESDAPARGATRPPPHGRRPASLARRAHGETR